MFKEVAIYFFRLGLTGFGGPLALVATMQRELVNERKWVSPAEFQKSFVLIKAMPGPVAFSSAVYLGRERAGRLGGALAGFLIVLPAFLMMIAFGWALTRTEHLAWVQAPLLGFQIAALAIVILSLKPLAAGFEKDRVFWILAGLSSIWGWFFPSHEPLAVVGVGGLLVLTVPLAKRTIPKKTLKTLLFVASGILLLSWIGKSLPAQAFEGASFANIEPDDLLAKLGWICFRAGAFVFGTGLAIVPMLESDFVTKMGWLSHSEFLNALALGQVTPGPVIITVSYVGYKVAGLMGAVVATTAVFASSFFHMMTWFKWGAAKLSGEKVKPFIRGALAAVLGFIGASWLRLMSAVEWKPLLALVFASALIILYKKKLPIWAVVGLSGLILLIENLFS